jgi:hypothetical protein
MPGARRAVILNMQCDIDIKLPAHNLILNMVASSWDTFHMLLLAGISRSCSLCGLEWQP